VATRRKYKSPPGYRDGGRIPDTNTGRPVDNVVFAEPAPLPHEPAAAPSPPAPQGDDAGDVLVRAHAAQMRAEEMHRQAAQKPATVEQHIDQIPGLSSHKRAFLKQHPKMATDPEEARAMSFAYQSALSAGVQDDTPEMDRAILAHMYREIEYAAKTAPPPAEAPRAPIAAPRKSMPMSAPVSRAVPSYETGRAISSKMTLTPEEVDIAHRSFVNRPDMPPLTNAQREYLYATSKRRYQQMKQDGTYSDQGRGSGSFSAGRRRDD
jgi:hypothetical protein